MNTQKNFKSSLVQMTDYIAELVSLMEKVNVLTDDVFVNSLDKIDLKSERGRFCAEYDINIARIKLDMMISFEALAMEKLNLLLTLSDEMLQAVNEKQ